MMDIEMQEVNDVFVKTEASAIHRYQLNIHTSTSSNSKNIQNANQSNDTGYPRSVFCNKSNKTRERPSKVNKIKNFFNRRKISDSKHPSHEHINSDNDNLVNARKINKCENIGALKFSYGFKIPTKSYNKTNIIISDSDNENVYPVFKPPKLTSISDKVYKLGERGSGFRVGADVQDFYKIRDECLQNGVLWEDPEFPATDSSIFYNRSPDKHFEWRRPIEIVSNPQFFVEAYSRFDVQQGELGNCWFIAAVANLTLYQRLFLQIVPDDQGFTDKYAGVFHFRFWQYGRWIDVVIDDRLPTYRGQLIYMHSTEENEFWSALLEKAYAKLHGSYEALANGSTREAMEDFTGGVTEIYKLNSCPPNLFIILLKAYERSSLMGCHIKSDPDVLEAETPEGLIRGHAYSITCVKFVDIQTPNTAGKIPLLRLRNPWGDKAEWKGTWSDKYVTFIIHIK